MSTPPCPPPAADNPVTRSMRHWIESVVVGLNLCPFAQRELARDRVRIVESQARKETALLADLRAELELLAAREAIATTVLVHPAVLHDFLDYNQFLGDVDLLVADLGFEGIFQVASFHPDYQFGGTEPEDPENYTNRSPYPALHLLREDAVAEAVDGHPDIDSVPQRNIDTMNALGRDQLRALLDASIRHGDGA